MVPHPGNGAPVQATAGVGAYSAATTTKPSRRRSKAGSARCRDRPSRPAGVCSAAGTGEAAERRRQLVEVPDDEVGRRALGVVVVGADEVHGRTCRRPGRRRCRCAGCRRRAPPPRRARRAGRGCAGRRARRACSCRVRWRSTGTRRTAEHAVALEQLAQHAAGRVARVADHGEPVALRPAAAGCSSAPGIGSGGSSSSSCSKPRYQALASVVAASAPAGAARMASTISPHGGVRCSRSQTLSKKSKPACRASSHGDRRRLRGRAARALRAGARRGGARGRRRGRPRRGCSRSRR